MDRYEEAVERARKLQENSNGMILKKWLWKIFPELKESEDERIRKWIIHDIQQALDENIYNGESVDEAKKAIAWLEKQGEQKPAWSEEDEEMLNVVIKSCERCGTEYSFYWLKSLKDRVQPQPQQEWGEKDEKMLQSIIDDVMPGGECPDYPNEEERKYYYEWQEKVDWLKSLRPQKHWKPSDEQIKALEAMLTVSPQSPAITSALIELYQQLKKLKE